MTDTVAQTAEMLGRTHRTKFDRMMPSYSDRLHEMKAEKAPTAISHSFLTLAAKITLFMVLAAFLLYGIANYFGDIVAKGGHSTNLNEHQVSVGDDVIRVPENMIRFSNQRHSGIQNRLDLYLHWPSMSGYTDQLSEYFNSMDSNTPIVFVSLEPRLMTKDMSGRINGIYSKFLSGIPVDAGDGLVRRTFSEDSAYYKEELYYEPNSPYPYAVRCMRASDRVAEQFCIRDIHVGLDLSLSYRFHASLLPRWLSLEQTIRENINKMILQ